MTGPIIGANMTLPNSKRGSKSKKKKNINFRKGIKSSIKSNGTIHSDQESNQTAQTNPNSVYRKHYNQSLKFFVWVI